MSKIILVTGASTGFGRLAAIRLAELGHTVYASMREINERNAGHAESLVRLAHDRQLNLLPIELDVTDEFSVNNCIDRILEEQQAIDVVINNAGIVAIGATEAHSPALLNRLLEVNAIGPHRVNRAVLPQMRKKGSGLIILVSSTSGRLMFPAHSGYSASKSAAEMLAMGLREEVVAHGVDVSILEPGAFPTEILDKVLQPDDTERAAFYPHLDERAAKLGTSLEEIAKRADGPRPSEVIDALVCLIEMQPGERPLRTVVDRTAGEFIENFNGAESDSRHRMLSTLGLN